MTIDSAPRATGRGRPIIGAILGWLGIGFALFTLYRAIELPFKLANMYPPNTTVNLMIPIATQGAMALAAIVICSILAVLCVVLQKRRARAWIIAAIAWYVFLISNAVVRRRLSG